jgi:hypothetical protein
MEWANYRKKGVQPMRPHIPGEDMAGISVSVPDADNLSEPGGMIARNPMNPADQWYVAAEFFQKNYEPA